VRAALHQQTDVTGLQGYRAAGVRAASGKNHLPGKRDFRLAGKALQKMKSCFLEILKDCFISILFSVFIDLLFD